jgi:hypothetical protein
MATNGRTPALSIRPIAVGDHAQWRPLWECYNTFYGRQGETALAEHITQATWERLFDPAEPVHALVATDGPTVVALAHYLFHRSTTRLHDVCYLKDLFTAPCHRGRRIGQPSRASSA